MKTKIVIALSMAIGLLSCKKQETLISSVSADQTISTTILEGDSYVYTAEEGENLSVLTDAQHARVSVVSSVNASGSMTYSYLPQSGFIGTDSVIIQISGEPKHPRGHRPDSLRCHGRDSLMNPPSDSLRHHPRRKHRKGKCNKSMEEGSLKQVVIRFNVVAPVSGE